MELKTDPVFLVGLANIFAEFAEDKSPHGHNFRQYLDFMVRTRKQEYESDIRQYQEQRAQNTLDAGAILIRPRPDIDAKIAAYLETLGEAVGYPDHGHESTLQNLYDKFGGVVRAMDRHIQRKKEQPTATERNFLKLVKWWKRIGLLFNSEGVDAQTFNWSGSNADDHFVKGNRDIANMMSQLEFKIQLMQEFNHPLAACTNGIVTADEIQDCVSIVDSQNNRGVIHKPDLADDLSGVGVYLKVVSSDNQTPIMRADDRTRELVVPVIHFIRLLEATFEPFAHVQIRRPNRAAKRKSAAPAAKKRKR